MSTVTGRIYADFDSSFYYMQIINFVEGIKCVKINGGKNHTDDKFYMNTYCIIIIL